MSTEAQGKLFARSDEESLLAEADFYEQEQRDRDQIPSRGEAAIHHGAAEVRTGSDEPPSVAAKKKKRIAITSREMYIKLLPTLPEREQQVMKALQHRHELGGTWPTAYELFHFMRDREYDVFDVNSVRPVLTRLKDRDLVRFGERRSCVVTGESAFTWLFAEQLQMALWPKET